MINIIKIIEIIIVAVAILCILTFKKKRKIISKYQLEILQLNKLLYDRTELIKEKNLKIKELQNEFKRKNNK